MDKLLKSVVKALLKACAPVIGSLTADIAEAGVSYWIDARDKAAAEEIAERLLSRLRESTQALVRAENVSEQQLSAALANVEAIIGKTQQFVNAWSAASFDAERAANDAVRAGRKSLAGLSDGEVGLVHGLVKAMFSVLSAEAKALEATEASFRRNVMFRLEGLATQLQQLTDAQRRSIEDAVAAAALSLRAVPWRPDRSPPGALLRADIDDPVPFHARTEEFDNALRWAKSSRPVAVRLYTGAGGIGKTRLTREVAMRLRFDGWRTGFLDSSATVDNDAFWKALAAGAEPRLYVIDYAENRRQHVTRLIRELTTAADDIVRRVILLARAGDDWWSQLKRQPDGVGDLLSGPATERIRLGPVAATAADRESSYQVAATHFSQKLRRPLPTRVPDDLEDNAYKLTLLLHMAALAAVEGVDAKGDQGVLTYVLKRERWFWSEHVKNRGLPAHLDHGVGRVMAAVTLAGGVDSRAQALQLMSGISTFGDQPHAVRETVAQMLHELYPGDRWIEPILPDLLGEHLIQEEHPEMVDLVLDTDGA
jgi:hypothetical protein